MCSKRFFSFVLIVLFLPALVAYALTFVDDTQAEFDAGTYSSTAWDTNHTELSSGQTSGTFTSQVFDAGASASWSLLGWTETLPSQDTFVTVDVAAGIFKSVNTASTFSSVTSDYNGAGGNTGVDDLVVTSAKVLYILHNTAVWRSTDYGLTWTERTSAYGGATGLFMAVESDDDLFVLDGGEDVWRSTDGGTNWSQTADNFNGGTGNVLGFTAFGTALFAVDVLADVWTSTTNGATWTAVNTDYNGATADGGTDYMTANTSGHLFVGRNAEVYRSTDSGVNWTQMTANYGDVDIQTMDSDSTSYLYVVNAQEEVYRSTDAGANFAQVSTGDINGDNGDVEGFVIFPVSVDLTFAVRSGSTNPPTDSFAGTLTDPSGGSPGVSSARYFQYRASFSSEDSGVAPELSAVTVTYSVSDTTAPSDVSTLAVGSPTTSTLAVSWTAPGDDASSGTATTYDLRYSTSAITAGNFSSATAVTGEPTPSVAGTSESMTVSGLSSNTLYYFALKTSDEVPNISAISNVPSGATSALSGDTTAPADISTLVVTATGSASVSLSWTAPGDDNSSGTATSYDLRYSTSNITSGNFGSATVATGEPTPSVAGSSESLTVSGLSLGMTYYFALKTADEVPNTSAISNVVNTTTSVSADTDAPSAVSNLALSSPTASSLSVSWTAPGDDASSGTATTYDLRYSTSAITAGNFSSATAVTGEPTPSVAGTSESMTVSGLSSNTLYYFALKTSDEVPNISAISNVPSGATSEAESTITVAEQGSGASPSIVFFAGQAYPGSNVLVLRKGKLDGVFQNIPLSSSRIDSMGRFRISYLGLVSSEYLFALQAIDKDGRKTGMMTFNADLLSQNLTVEDLLLPPTLGFKSGTVKRGGLVELVGYATPLSIVELDIAGKPTLNP